MALLHCCKYLQIFIIKIDLNKLDLFFVALLHFLFIKTIRVELSSVHLNICNKKKGKKRKETKTRSIRKAII